jgi:preprotein translocase subunit SecF
MDVIKYKYLFIGFSGALVLAALVSMGMFGFKQGIDFVGGTFWQVRFASSEVSGVELAQFLSDQGLENALVREGSVKGDFSIRAKELSEATHQEALRAMQEKFGEVEELSFASIGPAIGKELRNRSLLAFVLVLLGISLYIAFAFRKVSYPVSSWKYGFVTLVTLFHDALIPTGLFAYLGHAQGAEVDTNFIVAILVIMGFSVHDTIVVFDRIRERLQLAKKQNALGDIINESIKQTFARSVNTSLTLVIVLVALYFFGAPSLKTFTLMILIGTVIGTYSSIFVASPLLTFFQKRQ